MSEDVLVETAAEEESPEDGRARVVFESLAAALSDARNKLLDRSLRNKLINTPIASSRARQVRVFDEKSDEVFTHLRADKPMSFLPARSGDAEVGAESDEDHGVWIPPTDDELDHRGVASRHRDNHLQTRLTPEGLQKRLTSLFYEGQTLEEEQGINVLFLALGFLEWREAKQSEIARYAPLILLPVDLVRDGAKDRFKLRQRPDDLITNVSLQAWLKEHFGIALPDLPEVDEFTPQSYFDDVRAAVGPREGWAVHADEIVLGFFSFSKFLLWRDLDPANWPNPALLMEHPLLKDILLRNDEDALVDIPLVADGERVDEIFAPAELVHVTDADSSQAIAIQEAMTGKNLVIQGPPGTGKSQTITNIIAGAVHRGKRVLFVAEKMAALEVVHDRLVDRKLAPICLELHSRKSSKTQVLKQIKDGRSAAAPPAWPTSVFSSLEKAQVQLRDHSDRMHAKSDRLSAFELIGRMSLLRANETPVPSFGFADSAEWTADKVEAVRRRAEQLGDRLSRAGPPGAHPWRGMAAKAPDMLEQERLRPLVSEFRQAAELLHSAADAAREALGLDLAIASHRLSAAAQALLHLGSRPLASEAILTSPALAGRTAWLNEAAQKGRRLKALKAQTRDCVRAEAWADDWTKARRVLAGKGRSFLRFLDAKYRDAVAELRGVWVGDFPKSLSRRLEVLDQLIEAQRLSGEIRVAAPELRAILEGDWQSDQTDWERVAAIAAWAASALTFEPEFRLMVADRMIDAGKARQLAGQLTDARQRALEAFAKLAQRLELDEIVALETRAAVDLSTADLLTVALQWDARFPDIVQWPPIRDDLAWLKEIGCPALAHQIFAGSIAASHVEPILMLAIYEAMWGKALGECPEIGSAQGDELDGWVSRFKSADLDRIRIASDEVARAHIDQHPTGTAGAVGVLIDETRKTRNLKPVRKLMEEAGEAIQRFKPVFLMSPLSVAQYLKPGLVEFDLLVIDEASQIRPEGSCPIRWCSCGGVIIAISGLAGLISLPGWTG